MKVTKKAKAVPAKLGAAVDLLFTTRQKRLVVQQTIKEMEDLEKRIMLSRSTDGGRTWTATSQPVYDIATEYGADAVGKAIVHYPQVAAGEDVAYVMWEVWADATSTVKTLADAQNKTRPADLYVRRITFRR